MIKISIALLAIALLIPSCGFVQAAPRTCNVLKVNDGDTIRVNCGGNIEKIRFCGIDAPETRKGKTPGQPYGKESMDLVKKLLIGGKVEVSEIERDRYGRMVGELFVGDRFINAEIIKAGLAYHYAQYSKNCPNRNQIINAEAIAQRNKVGVWDGRSYQFPWDFRKENRRN